MLQSTVSVTAHGGELAVMIIDYLFCLMLCSFNIMNIVALCSVHYCSSTVACWVGVGVMLHYYKGVVFKIVIYHHIREGYVKKLTFLCYIIYERPHTILFCAVLKDITRIQQQEHVLGQNMCDRAHPECREFPR